MAMLPKARTHKKTPIWEKTLRSQIRDGQAIPLISSAVIHDYFLGGQAEFVRDYADYVRQALPDRYLEIDAESKGIHRSEEISMSDGFSYIEYLVTNRAINDMAPLQLTSDDLLQLAKFRFITSEDIKSDAGLRNDYVEFVKERFFSLAQDQDVKEDLLRAIEIQFDDLRFSEFLERSGFPFLGTDPAHPLMILAGSPFRIFLTTSQHNFIERALREAGKEPRTEYCRWHSGLRGNDTLIFETDSKLNPGTSYRPTEEEPLVYHLLGHSDHPESLVLTDDDYLRFLIAISRNPAQNFDSALTQIRGEMSRCALILLGYELHSWEFKAVLWGVIQSEAQKHLGISIQVKRSTLEQNYYERYLQKMVNCEVFWGTIEEYAQHLRTYLP